MKRERFFLSQISTNPTEIVFDQQTDWMQQILNELHEQLDEAELKLVQNQESIKFEGTIQRQVGTRYGDYAL